MNATVNHKDLGQATIVTSVADKDHVFVEVGGSVVRVAVSEFVHAIVGDSADALETLEAIKTALDNGNNDAAVAMLNQVTANSQRLEAIEAENEQFTIKNTWLSVKGNEAVADKPGWLSTPFIPINRQYGIECQCGAFDWGGIYFYDAQQRFISAIFDESDRVTEHDFHAVVAAADIPADAVYFRCCSLSYKQHWYKHAPNKEGRDGAMTEAMAPIIADAHAKKQQFTLNGYITPSGNVQRSDVVTTDEITEWGSRSLHTEFIPLNRNYDVIAYYRPTESHAAISYYDANKRFISSITKNANKLELFTYKKDTYPENAVYFRLSGYVGVKTNHPYYIHANHLESSFGAMADAAIEAAKMLPFIERWNSLIGSEAYDAIKNKFLCNGLELSYEEAKLVEKYYTPNLRAYTRDSLMARTLIFSSNGYFGHHVNNGVQAIASSCGHFEVLRVSADNGVDYWPTGVVASNCGKLHTILGKIDITGNTSSKILWGCPLLSNVTVLGLSGSLDWSANKSISLASWQTLIANAANTGVITITVHADVFATLSDTAQADWHKVMTDAAAKNISFATV